MRPLDWDEEAKKRGITPLEVCQQELRRAMAEQAHELDEALDEYIAEATAQFGEPSPEDRAHARDLARRLLRASSRRAG